MLEHTAEVFTTTELPVRAADPAAGLYEFEVEPLVVSLAVILVKVFVDRAPQTGVAKENHAIRRFAFE